MGLFFVDHLKQICICRLVSRALLRDVMYFFLFRLFAI
ncbi:MAG: hypothetical protein ACI8RD_005146 [Bacillariaceae sp.]|jgi:hypothetical protein